MVSRKIKDVHCLHVTPFLLKKKLANVFEKCIFQMWEKAENRAKVNSSPALGTNPTG